MFNSHKSNQQQVFFKKICMPNNICMLLNNSIFGFSKCALKGQQRLAQGKRSDTLGQSTLVSDAL